MPNTPRRPRRTVPPVKFDWVFWLIIGIAVVWLGYNYWKSRQHAKDSGPQTTDDVRPGGGAAKTITPDTTGDLLKIPGIGYPKFLPGQQVVRHRAYTLQYDEDAEQASWVAYSLSADNFAAHIERKSHGDHFEADAEVETGSATPQDYAHSGHDKGHLAPAGDMKFDDRTYAESFLMSNISPQTPGLNRGLWRRIEEKVRAWQKRDGYLLVVSGPVLQKGLPTIGADNVAVPEAYYKVVLDLRAPDVKMIGFLTPNVDSDLSIEKFVVSVDKIERETGMDFFPLLPDALENQLEAEVGTIKWFSR